MQEDKQQTQVQQQLEEQKDKQDDSKKFKRRDRLFEMQQIAQEFWKNNNTYQAKPNFNQKKFFVTFPYPYVNGRLHMGHAFSFTKSDFTARYKRLMGYNVLFSQGFHCTGMPISAAADKLKDEIKKYGNPPNFPPLLTGKKIKEVGEDGKSVQVNEQRKLFQYEILKKINIEDEEIEKFQDPYYWVQYFPQFAQQDLTAFGAPLDWSRSFITTDANPYYDSFIRWQFTILKEKNLVTFGKRPSIYSTATSQMCADHDRSEGEGVLPQEQTLIKIQILQFRNQDLQNKFKNRKVYLVAATLRPETMFGQTNCFILPTGVYGAFEMADDEVFICSDRSALNMSYQNLTRKAKTIEKICDINGEDLLGLPLKAPLTIYPQIYSLPMVSISMNKGTGIVTSVPSDSPDDWATLRDLKEKEHLRKRYNITEEMVNPFDPIPIINVEGLGNLSAIKICDDLNIKSQNDAGLLKQAKEITYNKAFYEGVFCGNAVGQFNGMKVQQAKPLIRQQLIESHQALVYYEPESLVISRSGDECIVAFCDQWYIDYNNQQWKNIVHEHVKTNFQMQNSIGYELIKDTVDWLSHWGCSRSYGLGTRLPFDEQFVIESLSDSTIYMAYYTIAHYLQGNVTGSQPGTLNIDSKDLNRDVWDYIFLQKQYNSQTMNISEEKLKLMKDEFNYWYPMDLRVSAKDLIRNHLTMSLFNHAAIWENFPEKLPKSYYCNGYILVNGKKMSKEKGNFFTIEEIIQKYGSDATRFACAEAGDGLEDANFLEKNADEAILKLFTLENWLKILTQKKIDQCRNKEQSVNQQISYFDTVFEQEMNLLMIKSLQAYEEIRFRDVTKYGFHDFNSIRDEYLINVGNLHPRKDLISKWVYYQLLLLFPVTPHFSEIIYQEYFLKIAEAVNELQNYPSSISQCLFPQIENSQIDHNIIRQNNSFKQFMRIIRINKNSLQNKKNQNDKSKGNEYNKLIIVHSSRYLDWQKQIIKILQQFGFDNETKQCKQNWKQTIQNDDYFKQQLINDKEIIPKAIKFGQRICDQFKETGQEALQIDLSFNEEQLIQLNLDKIKAEFGITDVKFIEISNLTSQDDKIIKLQQVKEVLPGYPIAIFENQVSLQEQTQ